MKIIPLITSLLVTVKSDAFIVTPFFLSLTSLLGFLEVPCNELLLLFLNLLFLVD